jgi:tryptophan halogenase
MKKQKFIVVGGGTARIIAASYLKTYWGDNIDIDLIYDHSRPSIGVGESLTPLIHNYLKYVGVSIEDLIKNVNATIKIGIQFENWNNDGKKFIHGFNESNVPYSTYNFGTAYEIVNGIYDHDFTYGEYWYDNALIPTEDLYRR